MLARTIEDMFSDETIHLETMQAFGALAYGIWATVGNLLRRPRHDLGELLPPQRKRGTPGRAQASLSLCGPASSRENRRAG